VWQPDIKNQKILPESQAIKITVKKAHSLRYKIDRKSKKKELCGLYSGNTESEPESFRCYIFDWSYPFCIPVGCDLTLPLLLR
jgi:hypothetical protein